MSRGQLRKLRTTGYLLLALLFCPFHAVLAQEDLDADFAQDARWSVERAEAWQAEHD